MLSNGPGYFGPKVTAHVFKSKAEAKRAHTGLLGPGRNCTEVPLKGETKAPRKTVREKIEDMEYETKLAYPQTKNFNKQCGACSECEHFVVDDAAFKAARTAYYEDVSRLTNEFKADLFAEYGVTGHPKADRVYQIAYDYGHGYGRLAVVNRFEELVDLIK